MLKIVLFIFPMLFLTGFVDSIAGGGGLISLPAYLLAGLPIHSAIATNKLSSAMGTTVSTVHFFRKGYMNLKTCIPGIIAALIGSWLGASLSLHLNEKFLKILVLFVLPFAAFHVLRSKNLEKYHDNPLPPVTTIILCTDPEQVPSCCCFLPVYVICPFRTQPAPPRQLILPPTWYPLSFIFSTERF